MPEICQPRTRRRAPRILCFGDSHTWGVHLLDAEKRYMEENWPELLRRRLGGEAVILDDPLCGRTTNLDDPKKDFPALYNGEYGLRLAMRAQRPVDGVVLFLGANDCKEHFNRTPSEIACAVRGLIGVAREEAAYEAGDQLPVFVIGPPVVNPEAPDFEKNYGKLFTASSVLKSMRVGAEVVRTARCEPGVQALNTASFAETNDGLHIDAATHEIIADRVYAWVKTEVLGASASMGVRYGVLVT